MTSNLNGKLIASYLNAIRHGDSDVLFDPTRLEIPPPSSELSDDLPNEATPRYQIGDRVQWRPVDETTDWGVVIGYFYTYARHCCQWAICYFVRLDENSPSAAWTVSDTVWEEDIEPSREAGESSLPNLRANQQMKSLMPGLPTAQAEVATQWRSPTPTPLHPFTNYSLRTPPGRYTPGEGDPTDPRTLTQREQDLIALYGYCQLGMTPKQFYRKWKVSYEQIALVCSRSTATVRRWFASGRNYRRPAPADLRHLALMDFLLEHFEEIPVTLRNLLFVSRRT